MRKIQLLYLPERHIRLIEFYRMDHLAEQLGDDEVDEESDEEHRGRPSRFRRLVRFDQQFLRHQVHQDDRAKGERHG